MIRISAIFVAVCITLISASLGAVCYLAFGLGGSEAAVVGIAAMTGLALYHAVTTRLRDRIDFSRQIADLSRGTADLAKQVGEFGRRLATVERKTEGNAERIVQVATPLSAELGELGLLVKQLAESVAAHDTAIIRNMAMANTELFAPLAAPVATPVVAPVATPVSAPASASVSAPANAPDSIPVSAPVEAPPTVAAAPVAPEPSASEEPEPPARDPDVIPHGRFQGMRLHEVETLVRDAVAADRIDFHLQPVVGLPQRKVRFYEALVRLRMPAGDMVTAAEFLPFADKAGLMPRIDNLMLFRCVRVVRRLMAKKGDVGVFCNVSLKTLRDAEYFPQFSEFLEANRAIAAAMVLEFSQADFRAMGPIELEALTVLAGRGFRFAIDNVTDLGFDPRDAADKHIRFIKMPAGLILGGAASDIHPADFAGLLTRYGVDLIADKVESEATVVELLDYDIKFGQGNLFSPPRPVRPEVIQGMAETADVVEFGSAPAAVTPAPRLSGLAQLARGAVSRS